MAITTGKRARKQSGPRKGIKRAYRQAASSRKRSRGTHYDQKNTGGEHKFTASNYYE